MTPWLLAVTLSPMGKVRRGKLVVSIVCLAVLLSLCALYFLAFPTFTMVSDPAWSACFTFSDVLKLRFSYLLDGYRLRIVRLESDSFYDIGIFSARLGRLGGRYVLLGPVSTSYAVSNGLDVLTLLGSSIVLGMGSSGSSQFDALMISDEKSGWESAARALARESSGSSSNVALVYDSTMVPFASDIIGCFGANAVSAFDRSGYGNLYADDVRKAMDKQSIAIAMCPYVGDFEQFFKSESSISWVVDYRFSEAVPSSNLYGVVHPVLTGLVERAAGISKGSHETLALEYEYEKR